MILPDAVQFRNCFDKALLIMISRGMDVKELVVSQLFYPRLWSNFSYFSNQKEMKMVPYNKDIEQLSIDDPGQLF